MRYKIVGDSCTDLLPEDMKKDYMTVVPLTIDIGGYEVVDDNTFNQMDFLKRIEEFPDCPKSACPSPEAYMKSFEGANQVYVVTLSSKVSGSYNSAMLAKDLYKEEHPDVQIHVFDSESAAAGQYIMAKKIEEYCLEDMDFGDVVANVTRYRDNLTTLFVLESLEALRKNGRLTKVKALVANALNIKPLMGTDGEGTIIQLGQARGIKKALARMIDYVGEVGKDLEKKTVVISHCNNLSRAMAVEKTLKEKYYFSNTVILETKGISTLYASDGGIIISF